MFDLLWQLPGGSGMETSTIDLKKRVFYCALLFKFLSETVAFKCGKCKGEQFIELQT